MSSRRSGPLRTRSISFPSTLTDDCPLAGFPLLLNLLTPQFGRCRFLTAWRVGAIFAPPAASTPSLGAGCHDSQHSASLTSGMAAERAGTEIGAMMDLRRTATALCSG